MAYLPVALPRAATRLAFRPRPRARLGCGQCTKGLGAVPVYRTLPFRRTFTNPAQPLVHAPARSFPHPTPAAGNGYTSPSQDLQNTNVNTTGVPSTILNYDKYGNPVYAVPPPGQAVTGYDAAGEPLYGTSSGSVPATSLLQTSAIVGYDSYGNPIYSGSAAASSLLNSAAAAAAPAASAAAPASPSDYQTVLDWLSESTLISSIPNWGVLAGGGALFLVIQSKLSAGRR